MFAALVNGEHENRIPKGNGYFQVPPHTPVIFGEAGARTLFRCVSLFVCGLVGQTGTGTHGVSLSIIIWLCVCVRAGCSAETLEARPSPCCSMKRFHSG